MSATTVPDADANAGGGHSLQTFGADPIALSELRFLFLFCPNNSGSTVMSQYIAEQTGAYLPPFGNNEGQMVPALRSMMRNAPWKESQSFDWQLIRATWEDLSEGKLFVEASPPNLLRAEPIEQVFGADSSAILSVADPYHQIASMLRRYETPGRKPSDMVAQWVRKARKIAEIRQAYPQFPLIRYQDFVADPARINRYLGLPVAPTSVRGKTGSEGDGIRDMRAVTTLFLTESEIDGISEQLEAHRDILEQFGFAIHSGQELVARLAEDQEALNKARARRAIWDAQSGPQPGARQTGGPRKTGPSTARQTPAPAHDLEEAHDIQKESPAVKQLLFVSGLARSGTSALVQVLNTNPGFQIGMERYFFPIRQKTLTPAHFERERFLSYEEGDTHKKGLPGLHGAEAFEQATYVGDKFPLLYQNFDYIFETFPEARHIYIVRNPLSVAESYDARERNPEDKWRKSWDIGLAEWNDSVRAIAGLSDTQAARFHFVQYEDFFADTARMNALYRAFGLDAVAPRKLSSFVEKFEALNTRSVARRDDIRQHVARHADWESYRALLGRIDAQNADTPKADTTTFESTTD